MSRQKNKVSSLLNKSRESAILAINIYNNPSTVFRSGGFIVLMHIAWTSLFHAIFEKKGIRYYHKDPKDRRRYLRIDGELKAWELSRCAKEYFKNEMNPKYQNICFFIGLRNKIEHRFMPSIDPMIFGECQAYLMNYEEILTMEFGNEFALADTLLFALQYSRIKTDTQKKAIKTMQSKSFKILKSYIDDFRNNLSTETLSNPEFSFRVFLIPKPANHQSSADSTIEFIKYDPSNQEEMRKYEHLVALIKEKKISSEIILSNNISKEKKEVLLVDRGNTNFTPVVGITRDLSKASGILVVEKLSEDIFNDINGIIEASSILYKRFDEFPMSERAFYFVYSGRENILDEEKAELLLKNGYQRYMPSYYWLSRIDKNKVRHFLEEAFVSMGQKFYSIMRLIVATEKESWINTLSLKSKEYDNLSQKPNWYWHFKKISDKEKNLPKIYLATQLHPNQTLFNYRAKELVNSFELANNLLTSMCLGYSKAEHFDRTQLRLLDVIVYYEVLKDHIPDVDSDWKDQFLKT